MALRSGTGTIVFSSKHYGAIAPEVFLTAPIPNMEPVRDLIDWVPEDDRSLVRVISHIKRCWNVGIFCSYIRGLTTTEIWQWSEFSSLLDSKREHLTLTRAELLEV